MTIFPTNLETKGRIIRGAVAFFLAVGVFFAWPYSRGAAIGLGLTAAFVAFEALRGWCALRACGLKTKF
jgi:hypothetical protein